MIFIVFYLRCAEDHLLLSDVVNLLYHAFIPLVVRSLDFLSSGGCRGAFLFYSMSSWDILQQATGDTRASPGVLVMRPGYRGSCFHWIDLLGLDQCMMHIETKQNR